MPSPGEDPSKVVFVTSAEIDDPLYKALQHLTDELPVNACLHLAVGGPYRPDLLTELVEGVAEACYVVVQQPLGEIQQEHVAAAAVARAKDTPLLLVAPAAAESRLANIANLQPRQVVRYPDRRDDQDGWTAFHATIQKKGSEVRAAYYESDKKQYVRPITTNLENAASALKNGAPNEDVALAIARLFEAHTASIELTSYMDYLQLDIPADTYPILLRLLTNVFDVRTIADPIAEQLPWRNPNDSAALAAVSERIFVIDERHARQYGLETPLDQLQLALHAGGAVSVVSLTEELRSKMQDSSSMKLKGVNRFYAGDHIVGGYADDTSGLVRLLAFKDDRGSREMSAERASGESHAGELNVLSHLSEERKTAPHDRANERTALASWIYSHIFRTLPNIKSIYKYDEREYADDYDGNIVRVTPGYFEQLDVLARESKRALVGLYAPFTPRERERIRVLELGFGTGTLTGRFVRSAAEFSSQMQGGSLGPPRPSLEVHGWDSNQWMVKIASERLAEAARNTMDSSIRPGLQHYKFEPGTTALSGEKYDLVLGSFVSHYWTDSEYSGPTTSASQMHKFRGLLSALKSNILTPGGMVLFLDAFYESGSRDREQRAWRNYAIRELGSSELADDYFSRNLSQYYAPATDIVEQVAKELDYQLWWQDSFSAFPFKILVLMAPNEL